VEGRTGGREGEGGSGEGGRGESNTNHRIFHTSNSPGTPTCTWYKAYLLEGRVFKVIRRWRPWFRIDTSCE